MLAYETVAIAGWEIFTFNTSLFLSDSTSLISKVQNKILAPIAEDGKGSSPRTWRAEADTELELPEGSMHVIGSPKLEL